MAMYGSMKPQGTPRPDSNLEMLKNALKKRKMQKAM